MSAPSASAGHTSLRHVVWELTLACDLACGHCGSRAGPRREGELSTDEALDVVRQVAEMGAKEVSLIGGEAYLRDDWHVIARAIHDAGMVASMVSGGRAFTRERARLAKEARVDSVSISIDGVGATHDVQRGVEGSFERAVEAMRNLRDEGVPVSANSQINRLSFPDLDGILDVLVEVGAHGWQLAVTVPMGRAADNHEWLLQPDDLLVVFPKLAELSTRARAHGVLLVPGNNVGYFGPHEDHLRGHLTELLTGTYFQGCGAGVSTLGLEADGAVKGCPSLPSKAYTGGHTRARSIREIWDETSELGFAREAREGGEPALWGFCEGCYYATVCKAGCSWTTHVYFGRRGNNPFCHHRALAFDARGEREELVRVAEAPGEPFDHGLFELRVLPARPRAEWLRPDADAPKRASHRRLRLV